MSVKSTPPKLISLSPGDEAERYNVDFSFPQLDEENRQRLKFEIEEAGQIITPILVMPAAEKGYIIIDGWHRYQISKELNMECHAVLFKDLSPWQAQEMFLSQNLSRRQMSLKEKKQLAIDLKQRVCWSNGQIANLLAVQPSTVGRWFKPKTLKPLKRDLAKMEGGFKDFKRGLGYYFHDSGRLSPEQRSEAIGDLSLMLSSIGEMEKEVRQLYDSLRDEEAKANMGDTADNFIVLTSTGADNTAGASADTGEAVAEHIHEEPGAIEIANAIAYDEAPPDSPFDAHMEDTRQHMPAAVAERKAEVTAIGKLVESPCPISLKDSLSARHNEPARPQANMYVPDWSVEKFVKNSGPSPNSS